MPFWFDIYKAFDAPGIYEITVVCGSQMSKTEGMFNILGHRFDDGPYVPALYIGPTEKNVKSMSKDRVDKMLVSTKSLANKLEKGQRNGVFEKFIGGIRLGFGWAGSATELASHPAGLVLLDEVDRMDGNVGGEGDPVTLARARAKNFVNRKIGLFSTPTLHGASAIWSSLDASGAIYFYAWHCIECKQAFIPQLSLLSWQKEGSIEERAESAVVACPHCGTAHETKHKAQLNREGRYIKVRKLEDREQVDPGAVVILDEYVIADEQAINARSVGFWISGLCSPWASFFEIAERMIKAYKTGDDQKIQAAINTYLGECFKIKGDAPDWQEVAGNILEYSPGSIPSRQIQFITVGADVQKNGIYYEVRGWGADAESWLLEHDFIYGETEYDNVWLAFGKVLDKQYGTHKILRAFIDSGYRPGDARKRPDHAVYTFCRRYPGLAYPTKGRDTMDTTLQSKSLDFDIGGKVVKNGIQLYHVNTDYFKRWVHARVRWPDDAERGGWHLHRETTEDYCRQIVSEELVKKPSGHFFWKVTKKDNHYFDTAVLAVAAAFSLNVQALEPVPEAGAATETPEQGREAQSDAQTPQQGPSGYERRSIF